MTREELIRELNDKYLGGNCASLCMRIVDELFLPEQRLFLEKIVKPLRDVKDCVLNRDSEDWCMETELYTAIDEALAIIEKEGGE